MTTIQEWMKAVMAGIGTLLNILQFTNNIPFIPSNWHTTLAWVIGALTTLLTWLVPNKTPAVKSGT